MRLFRRRPPASAEPEPEAPAAPTGPTAWDQFVERANALPLLTADEMRLFAETGQTVEISSGLRTTWSSDIPTQFLIRLRRTLLAASERDC